MFFIHPIIFLQIILVCSISYPYAYNGGKRCCHINQDKQGFPLTLASKNCDSDNDEVCKSGQCRDNKAFVGKITRTDMQTLCESWCQTQIAMLLPDIISIPFVKNKFFVRKVCTLWSATNLKLLNKVHFHSLIEDKIILLREYLYKGWWWISGTTLWFILHLISHHLTIFFIWGTELYLLVVRWSLVVSRKK